MKINEVWQRGFQDVIADCEVTNIKPITDEKGNVIKLIVEFEPTENLK